MTTNHTGEEIRSKIETWKNEWERDHPSVIDSVGPCSEPGATHWTNGYHVALECVLSMIDSSDLSY